MSTRQTVEIEGVSFFPLLEMCFRIILMGLHDRFDENRWVLVWRCGLIQSECNHMSAFEYI